MVILNTIANAIITHDNLIINTWPQSSLHIHIFIFGTKVRRELTQVRRSKRCRLDFMAISLRKLFPDLISKLFATWHCLGYSQCCPSTFSQSTWLLARLSRIHRRLVIHLTHHHNPHHHHHNFHHHSNKCFF